MYRQVSTFYIHIREIIFLIANYFNIIDLLVPVQIGHKDLKFVIMMLNTLHFMRVVFYETHYKATQLINIPLQMTHS